MAQPASLVDPAHEARRRRSELLGEDAQLAEPTLGPDLRDAAGGAVSVDEAAALQSGLGNGAIALAAAPPEAAPATPRPHLPTTAPHVPEETPPPSPVEAAQTPEGERPAAEAAPAAEEAAGTAAEPEAAPPTELPPPPAAPTSAPASVLHGVVTTPPSRLSASYQEAVAASGPALEQQRSDAVASIPELPAPTGLSPEGEPLPEAELPGQAPTPEVLEDVASPPPPPDIAVPEAPPPAPTQRTVLPQGTVTEDRPNDEAVSRSARAALAAVELPSEQVPSELGAPPTVDMTEDADPNELTKEEGKMASSVAAEKAKHAEAASQDFGENAIWPAPTDEVLRAQTELRGAAAPEGVAGRDLALDPEVAAGLDQSIGPTVQARLGEHYAEYDTGERRYEADSAAAHEKARGDIASLEAQARQDQIEAQNAAKSEVATQRAQWRREIDAVEADFAKEAAKKKGEHLEQVEAKRREGEEKAAKAYADAEQKAGAKHAEAKRDEEKKKKEAEEESDGFWGWLGDVAGSFIDALKDAVNFIYDNLRKFVKWVFEQAKKIALAAIDLARRAIVGLIKAFGEVLKGLVTIAFLAFPEIADRINAKIDDAVTYATDRVNEIADGLKKAVAAVLDFLASAIDQVLGLVQSIYNGVLTVIGMLVTGEFLELMEKIGWLVDAAKLVPEVFQQAALEELLGADLDQPLSPAELMQAGIAPPGVEGTAAGPIDPNLVPSPPWTEANVGVDTVDENFELSPELAAEVDEASFGGNAIHELAASEDESRALATMVAEAGGEKGDEVATEKVPDDGLTPMKRAEIRWQLMKDGIAKWWSDNWPKIILAAVAALVGFIALNIVTGGAITAAIPAIMGIIGPLFVGLTVIKLADYVKQYVELSWAGDIRGGGKALAKALAAGAIELISYLTFKAAGAALKGAKAVVKGGLRLAKTTVKAVSRGAKFVISNGKVLLRGIARSGIGKRFTKLRDLGKGLLDRLRFRKFRIVISGRWFVIQGFINPWITIAKGEITVVKKGTKDARFVSDDELAAVKKGLDPPKGVLRQGDAGTYKELTKHGRVGDKLTPDHVPSRAALVQAWLEKNGIDWAKLTKAERRKLAPTLKQINEEGATVAVKSKVHKAGRTFGGKNTKLQIAVDAKDLGVAFRKDVEATLEVLRANNELTPDIVGAYLKAYNMNVAKGWFKYSKDVDDMLMKYLQLARK